MKSIQYLLVPILLLVVSAVYAQSPGGINYQAVARDGSGNLYKSKALTVKAVILTGSGGSNVEYTETHTVTTNDYGLFTIVVGQGSTTDNFGALDWSNKKHHLKIEIDPGTGFVNMGVVPFQSVPYALSAKNVENIPAIGLNDLSDVSSTGATSGQYLSWDGSSWKPKTVSGGSTYTAGSGISITSNIIEANSSTPMWNANKLYGNNILNSTPTSGEVLKWNGTAWAPATDNAGSYTGGNGITITGSSIAANTATALWNASAIQGRGVATTAPSSGQILKWNGSSWAPASDNGSTYTAGTGITITGTSIAANAATASWNANKIQGRGIATTAPSSGQILKWNGTSWAPATDNGSTYTAGTGITITGTSIAANAATASWNANKIQGRGVSSTAPSSGQILKWNGSSWAPAADAGGSTYTAGTGLTLTGTAFSANSNSAIWNSNKLQGRNVSSNTPTSGQVLSWNGTSWAPSTVSSSGTSPWSTIGTVYAYANRRIGIGIDSARARLHVKDTMLGTAQANYASFEVENKGSKGATSSSYGIWNVVSGRNGYQNTGLRSWAGDSANSTYTGGGATGGLFYAMTTGGQNNFAVRGDAGEDATVRNYAIYAHSRGQGTFNMGVFALANKSSSSSTKTNYGIYAWADSATTNYAGYFAGNVTYTGTLAAASDARLKTNIQPFQNALAKLKNVQVSTYKYSNEGMASKINLPTGSQIGFVAQNLEKTFPELVEEQRHAVGVTADHENPETIEYKAVNYIGMIPVLTKAIQEQQEYIELLEKRLEKLELQNAK